MKGELSLTTTACRYLGSSREGWKIERSTHLETLQRGTTFQLGHIIFENIWYIWVWQPLKWWQPIFQNFWYICVMQTSTFSANLFKVMGEQNQESMTKPGGIRVSRKSKLSRCLVEHICPIGVNLSSDFPASWIQLKILTSSFLDFNVVKKTRLDWLLNENISDFPHFVTEWLIIAIGIQFIVKILTCCN